MTALTLDPVVGIALRGALAMLFLWAASHKLRDRDGFRIALANYQLVPARWIGPCTALVTAIEVGIAVGVLTPQFGPVAALGAGSVLTLYAGAMLINLRRGRRDIDCGCAGAAGRRSLSGGLVVRNSVLVAGALVSIIPPASRLLSWIDAITIAAAVATLALLYAATDGLLVYAPRIAALERQRAAHDQLERHHEVAHA